MAYAINLMTLLAKGGWFGEAKPGGFHRAAVFHMGLFFQEVPTVNPSVKNQRFLPAPFNKGAFLRLVSALPQIQKPWKAEAFQGIFLF